MPFCHSVIVILSKSCLLVIIKLACYLFICIQILINNFIPNVLFTWLSFYIYLVCGIRASRNTCTHLIMWIGNRGDTPVGLDPTRQKRWTSTWMTRHIGNFPQQKLDKYQIPFQISHCSHINWFGLINKLSSHLTCSYRQPTLQHFHINQT